MRYLAILLTGVLTLACAGHTTETARSAAAPAKCKGQGQVTVTNHTTEPVDIFLAVGGSQRLLGTVNAGRTENYPMAVGAQYAYVRQVRGASASPVDIRYSCE